MTAVAESRDLAIRQQIFASAMEFDDVANECRHERLAGDPVPSPDGVWPHPRACGCWGLIEVFNPPRVRTPDLMSMLNPKETPMEASTPEAPVAPYGYKANGQARKRPAPDPARVEKMRAARKAAMKVASPPANPAPEPNTSTMPPILATQLAQIQAEIDKLTAARDAIVTSQRPFDPAPAVA